MTNILFYIVIAFLISYLTTTLIVRNKFLYEFFGFDDRLHEVQKIHTAPVPRVGGLAIFLSFSVAILMIQYLTITNLKIGAVIIVGSLLAFLIGIIEDITKRISVKTRLLTIFISAFVTVVFLKSTLHSIGVFLIDDWLLIPIVSLFFTCFAITGIANAFNIIDGLNGLSSGSSIIILIGFTVIAYIVGDSELVIIALILTAAILGFMLWNYPKGQIFLGDGGAYFIGFILAVMSVLLVERHHNVSPWFPFLLIYYPIIETLFTIFRRQIVNKTNVGLPDTMHLHQLVYKLLINKNNNETLTNIEKTKINSKASIYLWIFNLLAVVSACVFFRDTNYLRVAVLVNLVIYLYSYQKLSIKTKSNC